MCCDYVLCVVIVLVCMSCDYVVIVLCVYRPVARIYKGVGRI